MIRWAAVVCASLSWLFAFHHFVVPAPLAQWSWIAAAWVLGAIGLRRFAGRLQLAPMQAVLLLPLGLILMLADGPYRPGAWLLACGLACGLAVSGRRSRLRVLQPTALAALVLGVLLVAQSPCYWVTGAITARSQQVPLLGGVVYGILNWLGSDVSYSAGVLHFRMMRNVHPFPLTWNHVGLMPLLCMWLAALCVAGWRSRRGRLLPQVVKVSWIVIGYALARLVFMILVFISAMVFVKHEEDVVHVEVFWMPWISALSWLPLAVVLGGLVPWPAHGATVALLPRRWDRPLARLAAVGAACVACCGALLATQVPDKGLVKQGRILLDESHSEWERTDNVYDTDWYGHESGYNYYCMAQYLKHFYHLDFNMEGVLTPHKLADYDVLILKTPTEPYSDEELDTMEAFVRAGGGLYVLGEHTAVFGSSMYLNPLVMRFGIQFRYDSVFDIERKWEQMHFPGNRLEDWRLPLGLSASRPEQRDDQGPRTALVSGPSGSEDPAALRDRRRSDLALRSILALLDYATEMLPPAAAAAGTKRLSERHDQIAKEIDLRRPRLFKTSALGVHPIMQHVPFDRFAVSCSIASRWLNVRPVIRSSGLWTLPIDYTAGNFYPHVEDRTDATFGVVDQMVAATAGAGRVVAFADSTVYSNFLAFYPGKAEKLIGTVEWLNRRNAWSELPAAGLLMFTLGAAVLVVLRLSRLRAHLGFTAAVVSCSAATAWGGLWLCADLGREWYPPPAAHTPVNTVVFDVEYGGYELPMFGFTQNYQDSFEIFYQWVLRLGYFTDVAFNLEARLQRDDPVVIIRPRRGFPPPVVRAAASFVDRGGTLLVLDSPGNAQSTANELLAPFGLAFAGQPARGSAIHEPATATRICQLMGGRPVEGGQPLLVTNAGEPIAAAHRSGSGTVIAAGLADRFADTQMGGSSRAVPSPEQRAVFELQFALVRGLVEGDVEGQIRQLAAIYAKAP